MNISYIRVLQNIESFASSHLQVRRFASDFYDQLNNYSTLSEEYPILFVTPQTSLFDVNTNQFTVDVYCFDIIQKSRENINTILSDTSLILNDLNRWVLDGELYGIDLVSTSQATPINDALLDYVAGWKMTMTLEVDTYGICEIPFSDAPVIITEVNNIVYSKYLTCETLEDCDTFNNAIDGLQLQIDNIELTPGPTGPTGSTGPIGATGTSLLTAEVLDTYLGSRLRPTDSVSNGFSVAKSVNACIGLDVRNTSTGNGALSSISVGAGGLYDKGASLNYANTGYYIAYLRNSGFLYSDIALNVVAPTIALRVGPVASPVSILSATASGQIKLPTLPTLDNTTTTLLGRKSDGSLVTLDKTTKTSQLINDGDDGVSHFISLNDLPSNIVLYPTTATSSISGYYKLVSSITDPSYNATASNVTTGEITTTSQLISSLVTSPNLLVGNPGVFNITTIGNIRRTSGSGEATFYFQIYKRTSAGTETLIATSDATIPVVDGGTYNEFSATALWNDGIFLPTDMVVMKFYGSRISGGSNPTYEFQFGGTTPVRTLVPIPLNVVPTNIKLDDIIDVTTPTPSNNDLLVYETSTSQWKNKQIDTLSINNIIITTTASITTNTTDSSSYGQNGRNVMISNGANTINLSCEITSSSNFVASYTKLGASTITFIAGSGATLVQVDGTNLLNGSVGSTACLTRNGNTYYLQISNR